MNKKGQGLPLNVLVVAILVIVVLILVVTFFFGGFTNISVRIKDLFFTGTAGTSETLAIQSCQRFCDNLNLRDFDTEDALKKVAGSSNFCRPMDIDLDGSGVIEVGAGRNEKDIKCSDPRLGVTCKVRLETGVEQLVSC